LYISIPSFWLRKQTELVLGLFPLRRLHLRDPAAVVAVPIPNRLLAGEKPAAALAPAGRDLKYVLFRADHIIFSFPESIRPSAGCPAAPGRRRQGSVKKRRVPTKHPAGGRMGH
jgi:hypothetical protein